MKYKYPLTHTLTAVTVLAVIGSLLVMTNANISLFPNTYNLNILAFAQQGNQSIFAQQGNQSIFAQQGNQSTQQYFTAIASGKASIIPCDYSPEVGSSGKESARVSPEAPCQ